MKATMTFFGLVLCIFICAGCQTTYNPHGAPAKELAEEGSIVFVRPDRYTVLGTRSVRDYIEITYEKLTVNEAGMPVLQVGLRNRGGQHWWDVKGPQVVLSAKVCFYADPVVDTGPTGPPVYETNWQAVPINRGGTAHFEVVCPYNSATYYQLTLSELIR